MSRYLSSTNSTDSANMMRYLKERQCSQLLRHAMSSYFQAIAKARQENDFDRLAYLEDPKSFFLDHFSYIHSESDQQQQEEPDHRLKTVDGPSNSNIRWSLRPTSAGGWQARQPTQDVKAKTAPPAVNENEGELVKIAIEQLQQQFDDETTKVKELEARLAELHEMKRMKESEV
mmetsp:Transcript_12816/g.45002  ORF Transcript_12816/g.45002 Transcript_12816/m.45002 type:complete len:174 (-) Transcript_12816:1488-2009(-)